MREEVRPVEVLLLTEDTGDEAFVCLKTLLLGMLVEIAPRSVRLPQVLRFLPGDAPAREAMGFNRWKERGPGGDERRRRLAQTIATFLLRSDRPLMLVLVHVDADVPWSACASGSENLDRFEAEIRRVVRAHLLQRGLASRDQNLLMIAPYYHLESWLFQNGAVLEQEYKRRFASAHPELETLRIWAADPAALDEVRDPKGYLKAVGNSANRLLAERAYPVRRAREIGKSFAATMALLEGCGPLGDALRSLAAPWERAPWETPST